MIWTWVAGLVIVFLLVHFRKQSEKERVRLNRLRVGYEAEIHRLQIAAGEIPPYTENPADGTRESSDIHPYDANCVCDDCCAVYDGIIANRKAKRSSVNVCPRVEARIACDECGYPLSEAMYDDGDVSHVGDQP